jgi:ATP-binding cassette subfamily F protein 3
MATVEIATLIQKSVPEADDAVVEYISGYLEGNDFADDEEDGITEFVRPMLLDVGGKEDEIDKLCEQLVKVLSSKTNNVAQAKAGLNKLAQPINMASQSHISATVSLMKENVDLQSVRGRTVQSQVDATKLKKAEAKIAAKMAKRQAKSNMAVDYEASRLIQDSEQKALEEAYKMYNPILDYTTTKGKSKDIKLENFDISFGGKRILTDANVTLAFGRRYGLVGKNGIGKSTLLKAMARRELNVPTHISLLYVEQEVIGDDTPALDMVLKADVWRTHLLNEEKRLSAEINELDSMDPDAAETEDSKDIEKRKESLHSKLRDVYQKLEDIESNKAEARYVI